MKNTYSSSHPLRIDSIQPPGVAGHIGMTIWPGKQGPGITAHWERSLEEDLNLKVFSKLPDMPVKLEKAIPFQRYFPLIIQGDFLKNHALQVVIIHARIQYTDQA